MEVIYEGWTAAKNVFEGFFSSHFNVDIRLEKLFVLHGGTVPTVS